MKKVILSLLILLVIFSMESFGGELTGAGQAVRNVLLRSGIDVIHLEESGYKILAGELTGAGKRASMAAIKIFVANGEVLYIEDVDSILVGNKKIVLDAPSAPETLRVHSLPELKGVESMGNIIARQKIQGIVILPELAIP
ncbi:MAG: hypothetical protein A2504_11375 [Bdellovibrionales bacterium RIFOXYD12_FULL_39_22]|nr:MAG: hypothetical protein A2385_09940 [Bdellovibrionales bacterium RIFOXYB1_FULL_39_21]OFZ44272.1 MAG: hypothetical protein A2485_07560 [Bdellovibrionales bacterium RIFOXYC12_FULL_39_17]OFZ46814.1 MAG: hypothetical protein A2404_04795 [Bdellovibrionales bacterium RIFOXYC1_FULL_39_130]OFZ71005.1 MAG: hypothetical protein A2451_00295 [Bdellovibrionales bacterium RIFOXYC2_FULL_39_8]OFZ75909.1 MAG: hypothetical protein A2560_02355 [Bdellovibrionales bacterium RIFOXYD1_FULL_39_84]OFZ95493.1 MAG: